MPVSTPLEERLGAMLARVAAVSERHATLTVAVSLLLAALSLGAAAQQLGVISNTDELFDAELPFVALRATIKEALPRRADNVLVVVDAPSGLLAGQAADALARRLDGDERFDSVFVPGGGPFFERNGFLYLSVDELAALADDLSGAQPFIAGLTRDPSLRGLLDQLRLALEHGDTGRGFALDHVLDGVLQAIADAEALDPHPERFGQLVLGGTALSGDARRYVLVEPAISFGDFVPGRAAAEALREVTREVAAERSGVTMRLTGDLALKIEELTLVRGQAAAAGVASFVAVSAILWLALRRWRLIAATLTTLACGLCWTAGFATGAIGHLNLISVAFAVLFIGLGVDFGIHLCLRYRELREGGRAHADALDGMSRSVGAGVFLCAITTAIGFYAFVPTDYLGVAELGAISGTGMLLSLVGSFTLLPAMLSLGRPDATRWAPSAGRIALPQWPLRAPRTVASLALVVGIGSLSQVPALRFDANPLNVRDPNAESVQAFEELIDGGDVNPWSIEVLVEDLDAARALAARLERLEPVAHATTLASYVPQAQEEKLALIDDLAFLLELPTESGALPSSPGTDRAALLRFRSALDGADAAGLGGRRDRLRSAIDGFLADEGPDPQLRWDALRAGLLDAILDRLARLSVALQAEPVSSDSLPAALRERALASDGRALVEVLPAQSLADDTALDAFVESVRGVTDDATGASVYMFEASRAIVSALQQALATALVLVTLILLVLWRNLRDTFLVLAPLILAGLVTGAICVQAGLPINFADVIVVPLLLGIGVDSGIHLVHRFRSEATSDQALLESTTPRAIFWSAITTISSFGSLGFASHLGMASLGQLLTLGVAVTLAANLLVLPALIAWLDGGARRGA